MDARPRFPAKPFKWLLLGVLFGLGMWYAGDAVIYAFIRERPAEEPWIRTIGSFVHLTVATPLLLIAPLQFSRRMRAWWPHWHRRTGRAYLSFAMVAAIGAIYLGVTFERVGSRVPLAVFAILWLAFSVAAWICARRRAFPVH